MKQSPHLHTLSMYNDHLRMISRHHEDWFDHNDTKRETQTIPSLAGRQQKPQKASRISFLAVIIIQEAPSCQQLIKY